MSFINLSHAIRNGLYKPLVVKKTVNQTPNSEKQVCYFIYIFKVKIYQLFKRSYYVPLNKIFVYNFNFIYYFKNTQLSIWEHLQVSYIFIFLLIYYIQMSFRIWKHTYISSISILSRYYLYLINVQYL